jgi:hypothetical protein
MSKDAVIGILLVCLAVALILAVAFIFIGLL